jgi:hypothetical protein
VIRILLVPAMAMLALAGCVTPEEQAERAFANAVEALNAAAADAEEQMAQIVAEEFVEAARNCELSQARLVRAGEGYNLGLPPALYAGRNRAPNEGRVNCLIHWGRERGLNLTIVEAR